MEKLFMKTMIFLNHLRINKKKINSQVYKKSNKLSPIRNGSSDTNLK